MIWEKVRELEERLEHIKKEINEIEKELASLPSGHIDSKKVNDNQYYYLRYWEDGKLKSRYIGKDASAIKAELERSAELRQKLARLKEEESKLQRALDKVNMAVISILF
ncbi:hypothetical protein [Sulfuracidifex metallicus]|jgi:prefoldin subunit 5|uniref:DUF6788 domain-containing protein n=1 Tax=Sulfuracidifex metallicus DSM 6482 = JCM 9184 TaxID=523847 RepID=A0A6A9QWL9_SULME|nr:hypothetical protein [Sulfuracidifex metallicus]MUN29432.1 hypothetical protein [Sulfuracidifex metallicus DSM 6482 = JCM 9184]WOE50057.1 hypothetical protein RQ359_001557 [Sulfuracidifex metallicus DSM 6482 = JCM 9184]